MGLPDPSAPRIKPKTYSEREKLSPRPQFSAHLLYNLSRPAKSLVLLAPLGREAGGYGLCRGKNAQGKDIFSSAGDPDYQTLLTAMRGLKEGLDRIKRFDMPGFRPNEHYVREMKRYGILANDLPPDSPIDIYATDRAYWRSFWYLPPGT